jgi:hypothetical protein
MQRLLTYVLATGLVGTSTAMLVQRDVKPQNANVQLATDAAYRDGLYLGKLARAAKREGRVPIGRWATEKDRASFVAGYREGLGPQSAQD